MRASGSRAAMLDTCFVYALFEPQDQYFEAAGAKAGQLDLLPLAVPWPCFYETLNTRFAKNPARITQLDKLLKRASVELVDDAPYRDRAYEMAVDFAVRQKRPIALVDMVCRLMLDDVNLNVGYLFTFNPKDFVDVCRQRGIELL